MRPPRPYSTRSATPADAAAVAALSTTYEAALVEDPDETTAPEVAGWWVRLDLDRDTLLVHHSDGTLAAAGTVEERRSGQLDLDGYVHPEHVGRGLGGFLLDWLERESSRRGCAKQHTATLAVDRAALDLLAARRLRADPTFLSDADRSRSAARGAGLSRSCRR